MILGPFGVAFGVHDVKKGVKILLFWMFDFINGSPPPKRLPMLIFRSKQLFYRVFWHFRWFSGHLGSFWGSVTSQKGSRFSNFGFLTLSSVFPPQKDCPCTFSDPKNHFIEFSGFLGDFRTILGHFRGPWRHKRGQDFIIYNFWLHHRFSHQKNLPIHIFRSKQSLFHVLLSFRLI